MNEAVKLQVLICTYGAEGIDRVAKGKHPVVNGVEYIVSWQASDCVQIPHALLRGDFRIYRTDTLGLSKNRNNSLSKATAPIILISDDDVDYTAEGLRLVMDSFAENSGIDIITFEYVSKSHKKFYPGRQFSLDIPEKGYFITSFEIALKRDAIVGKIWFNESFGIGAQFPSGEEDVFLKDCLDAGLKGIFLPSVIARHDGTTTSMRNLMQASRPLTKGAVFRRLHPKSWIPRMIVHALREIPLWRKGLVPSPFSYCLNWIRGAKIAKRQGIYPTPDYGYSLSDQPLEPDYGNDAAKHGDSSHQPH